MGPPERDPSVAPSATPAPAVGATATRRSVRSAGVLLWRRGRDGIEVLLGHPGGPYFARKDLGAWSIPKGTIEPDEEPRVAARREFAEETGIALPPGEDSWIHLGEVRQKSGKTVAAWGVLGDCDPARLSSIPFSMEWPPRSGRTAEFPEIDRFAWFGLDEAKRRLLAAQVAFLDRLAAAVAAAGTTEDRL